MPSLRAGGRLASRQPNPLRCPRLSVGCSSHLRHRLPSPGLRRPCSRSGGRSLPLGPIDTEIMDQRTGGTGCKHTSPHVWGRQGRTCQASRQGHKPRCRVRRRTVTPVQVCDPDGRRGPGLRDPRDSVKFYEYEESYPNRDFSVSIGDVTPEFLHSHVFTWMRTIPFNAVQE